VPERAWPRGSVTGSPPPLVVVNGAIGCGKSPLAGALASLCPSRGRTATVAELDLLYLMQDDRRPIADCRIWHQARVVAGVLAQSLFSSGAEIVIVAGAISVP
jgi:pantothenate kinase-related protein Tda10